MIISYALLLFLNGSMGYSGTTVPVAASSTPGFYSQAECVEAGNQALKWAPKGTTFVCVKQSREPEPIVINLVR